MMTEYVAFGDIVEENGKTIRQNNMEQVHSIPAGALVEVKYTNWHGDGACEKVQARLWVVKQGRDCDGTPLYWLSKKNPNTARDRVMLYYPESNLGGPDYQLPGGLPGIMFTEEMSQSIIDGVQGGFSEESLTVIEITDKIKDGYDSLSWDEEN
jgi:hypothetical protein